MERHSTGLITNRVYSITIVNDSYHAFDLLAMKNYDVIVINEELDDMSAQETAQIIRGSNPAIPLLLLAIEEETPIACRLVDIQNCGFSHVLANPFTDDDYFAAIDFIEKTALQRPPSPPPILPHPFPTSSNVSSDHINAIMRLALERLLQQRQQQQTRPGNDCGSLSPHPTHIPHYQLPPSASYHPDAQSPPQRSIRQNFSHNGAGGLYMATPPMGVEHPTTTRGHYSDHEVSNPSSVSRAMWGHPDIR